VKIQARVGDFNGKTQLTIVRARRCEECEYSLADFLPSSKRDPEEMLQDLSSIVAGVADPGCATFSSL